MVDDGSGDGTADAAILERPAFEAHDIALHVLRNPQNRGKGFSVRRGMRAAKHDWVLFSDADESAPISEVEKLLQAAGAGEHDVAIGSRALNPSLIGTHQPKYREVLGRLFNFNVRLVTGLNLADTQCGFKLFSRRAAWQIASQQRLDRFGFDVELLYLARKMGYSIAEVPIRWNNAPGSSVGMGDGLAAFAEVWKVKWNDLTGNYP